VIPLEEAQNRILATVPRLPEATVALADALGLVTAEDLAATEPIPPFANTGVDGYAVRAADTAGATPESPVRLRVVDELPAGKAPTVPVGPGEAIRIMTGAPMPPGADAVVMVEDTSEQDGIVDIQKGARAGENVQPAGHDLERGQVVLRAGSRLGPPEIGMLASVGKVRVPVYPRPKVAVLATGDELVEPHEEPPDGALRDSNRFALMAAAREAGAEVVWQAHGRDERDVLERLVREALDRADVLITSGGVSMGTRDLIKPLLAELGEVHFGRIAFKPGKPLTFVTIGEKLAFGLPGYPVSSLVTFEVFVRPALLKLQGLARVRRPRVRVYLEHELQPDRGRLEYQRAVVRWESDRLVASSTGLQSSSRLLSMIGANALLEIQPGTDPVQAGTAVPALLTGELLD
jgi:molybdopterin molybdotransferase